MSVLTLPAGLMRPSKLSWNLQANSLLFKSSLTGNTQAAELPGARWVAMLAWTNLPQAQWRLFEAFKAQLRGASGQLYVTPFHAMAPQAAIPGSPVVAGASQVGNTLATSGWGANGRCLQVGDYFSFVTATGQELKIVTASPGTANGSGSATLTFEPPIRNSPNSGAAITVNQPSCIMGATDDKQGSGTYTPGPIGAFQINLEERF